MVKRATVSKKNAIFALIFAVWYLFAAVCLLSFPRAVSATEEAYDAVWENGRVSRESYREAYSALCGCESDKILLERGGLRGEIAAGEPFADAVSVLRTGGLTALLTAKFEGLSRLERAALYRAFGDRAYLSSAVFAFDGEKVFRTPRGTFGTVVLLDGIASGEIRELGAKKLILRAAAQLTPAALVGSAIEEIEGEFPYTVADGAVYLDTVGGRRLVAALPVLTRLCAADCIFCDEGALSPCTQLAAAELPFAGNGETAAAGGYDGRLLWAFGEKIPETLKRVKISGGEISSFAFTGCENVEEIDLCGIPAGRVSPSAFEGCARLLRLHTARELSLAGFARTALPCGCFLYERSTR